MVHIRFDPKNKLIRIEPFYMTLQQANEGDDYVLVDSINPEMPQQGWLSLSKSKAQILGTNDLSGGYDFATDPRNFLIISGDGLDYETVTLDRTCTSAAEIASLINEKLQQTEYATQVEAFTSNGFVGLRQKDPYWGETFSFVLDYGDPDALTILGISPGSYVGTSDVYEYTSWSGNTIYISGTLTRTYPTGVYCAGYYSTLEVQEIYNAAMDWSDDPEGMSWDVPMSAGGYFPLGGGVYTDKIFVLKSGWRILPHQGNYRITFKGTLITEDGGPRVRLPRTGIVEVTFQVATYGSIARVEIEKEVVREPLMIP